ncbi:hypothetical protein SapgrDRAFT_1584 [Saprospira grandis DSM 2844]|uniref:Uncharacterized protein n=1 Tax=Saprospira grandis DSM 2844 TaxID=694433 RepID=J1I3K4_9BACT|nr:DUF4878 domain-containing protein [Saprospira grandis]EJF53295.1 hypothetical protein SapgrDRAFT_1584 [Saprospira grandis DSM 2844]
MRLYLLFFIGLFLLSTACHRPPGKLKQERPESVALHFMHAFLDGDFEKAEQLSTPESKEILAFFEQTLNAVTESERKAMKAEAAANKKRIKTAECELLSSQEALCSFCCDQDGKPLSGSKMQLLRQEDNSWKVVLELPQAPDF